MFNYAKNQLFALAKNDESAALVEVSPRKALPGPRDKKDRPKSSGTVPSVPRRKDD